MDERLFVERTKIEYSYCDWSNAMKLSYLLGEAQEVSMEHCDALGIGGDYFMSFHKAFLLAKLRGRIWRMPRGGEEVIITTQPNMPVRSQYRRITRILDVEENVLVELDSRWILVDMDTKRIVRRLPEGIKAPFVELTELEDFRSSLPDQMTETERVRVRYNMVDINRHLNNAIYGDLISNLLEDRLFGGETIGELALFYHREAKMGDELVLYTAEEGQRFHVRGEIEGNCCFEASVTLVPGENRP